MTGRKNYLFVGSERAGHSAAVLYSLVSSAKANGVEPFAWLRDLFTRLPYHRDSGAFQQAANGQPVTSTELDYLLPDKWLAANPTHDWSIDQIRRQERKKQEVTTQNWTERTFDPSRLSRPAFGRSHAQRQNFY